MNDQLNSILEQQLREAHTPEAISWWPLAIGWWVLIVLTILAIIFIARALYQRRRRNLYRRTASKELDFLFVTWQEHQINNDYLQAANSILKRASLHISDKAVSLSGKPWLAHLNAHCKTDFSVETETALTQQLYQQQPECDIEYIHAEIQSWLIQHTLKHHEKMPLTQGLTHA